MDERTRDLIERYVAGTLDEGQAAFLEEFAGQEPEVERAIEEGLSPVARAFRSAFPYLSGPNGGHETLRTAARRRAARWATFAAAAASGVFAYLFWPKAPEVVLVSTEGSVIVNGRELAPGDAVPFDASVVAIGSARFRLRTVEVASDALVGGFSVSRSSNGLEFRNEVGVLAFKDTGEHSPYRVAFGGSVARPLGTRFSVSAPSRQWLGISVFDQRVEVTQDGKRLVVSEGEAAWNLGSQGQVVKDDPAAIPVGGTMKVPTRAGLVDRVRLGPPALPVDLQAALGKIAADHRTPMAEKQWRMSLEMARAEEAQASAHLATAAVESGFVLADAREADLWTLVRCHAGARGDHLLASRLIDELDRRAGNSGVLEPYRALATAWDAPEDKGQLRITAAQQLEKLGRSEDRFLVAEGLIFGFQEWQVDKSHLRHALNLLDGLLADPALTVRSRAFAFHRKGEAHFYLGEKRESVQWTMRAVELWPRPSWKVHVGTRMTECDLAPLDEALRWIEQGLIEEPSYYAYERAAVAMYAGATELSDFEVRGDLLAYIGRTFGSVPDALAHMAQSIGLESGDIALAEPLMSRAVDLWEGTEAASMPQSYRNDWGAILVRAGRTEDGWAFALADLPETDPGVTGFFVQVRDWPRALASLDNTPVEGQNADFHFSRAQILQQLGRRSESFAEVAAFFKAKEEFDANYLQSMDVGLLAHVLVIQAEVAPRRTLARRLAQQALDVLEVQNETSRTGKAGRSLIGARAHFILGRRDHAVQIVRAFLTGPIVLEQRREAERLLALFQAR